MSRGTTAATALAGLALLTAAPLPGDALATLASTTTAGDPSGPLLATVALAAWALLGWLLVVAAVAWAARFPGATGRVAAAINRRIAPAGVRRLVEISLGLTVAVGVLGASPASAGTHLPPAPPAAAASLDWPTPPSPAAAPSLDWNPPPAQQSAPRAAAPVVVQPGDSLWAVAADRLPAGASNAQIAQAWPTWWSANRAAVGPDPGLIHPGLSLTPPTTH